MPFNGFDIYQTRNGVPETDIRKMLWSFRASRDPVQDLPVSQSDIDRWGFNRGYTRWADGDRISYHTVYAFVQHQDPGHHDFVNAIRFQWQDFGATNRLLDQGMAELGEGSDLGGSFPGFPKQGLAPYPYERVTPLPVNKSRPGAVVEIFHLRNQTNQLLQRFVVPAIDPATAVGAPQTRWFYQLNGLVVAVNDELGVIAKIIIAGMHPAYTYRIQGVATAGV